MSDLGLLSHKYQTVAELARQLRRNVLLIKRFFYRLLPLGKEQETEVNKAFSEIKIIIEFLIDVIPLNEEVVWPVRWVDEPPISDALVEQLRKIHILDSPRYVRSLKNLREKLQDPVTLKEKDIFLLEEIAYTASNDANTVFRKLMRWA
jgi:hypothetical protein